jgi:hypothetical protein
MKAVAKLASKSQVHAVAVAVISAAFPLTFWIAAALVGLVTLRKGQTEGSHVLIAALVGGIAGYMMTAFPLTLFVAPVTFTLALVLRNTVSWPWTLMAASGLGLIGIFLSYQVLGSFFDQFLGEIESAFSSQGMNSETDQALLDLLRQGIPALFPAGIMDLSILCLLLARYWQSALYNPGGFRQEFHQLRLRPWMVLTLIVVGALISSWNWFAMEPILMPLLIAALALVHGLVAKKDLGGPWIAALYFGLFILSAYLLPLLILAAIADAWLDLRSRVKAADPDQ